MASADGNPVLIGLLCCSGIGSQLMTEKGINPVPERPQAPEDVTKTLLDPMANPCYYLGSLFVLFPNNMCPRYE